MINKYTIIGVSAGVFILVLSFAVFLGSRGRTDEVSGVQPTVVPEAMTGASVPRGTTTYQEFVRNGKPQICRFGANIDGSLSTGSVYSANGKIRADFTAVYTKGTVQQHMIVDSYMAFLWTNVNNEGIKFPVEEISGQGINSALGLDKSLGYKCEPWSANEQLFELPPYVVFKDFTELNPSAQPTIPPQLPTSIQPQPTIQ